MEFKVSFPQHRLREAIASVKRRIKAETPAILEAIGVRLLSFAQQDYRVKARGGTGSDGIKWAPLAASTIKRKGRRGKRNESRKTTKSGKARPGAGSTEIGVDTGLQRASGSPGFNAPGGGNIFKVEGVGVTVGYGRTYSKYFDEKRALLPEELPAKWRTACEELLERQVERILQEELE